MRQLGKYEIFEKIGSGSMGTVYRAHDSILDRDVALKIIRTGEEVDSELRERFYREARSCGRLQHPGIVTVYDLAESDRLAYIAMELLHGSDFRTIIVQQRKIPFSKKLEAIIQVCSALHHAHTHGVIHRDIKPSNLFLNESTNCAKVLDFGIARLPSSKLTVVGNVLGTPNYMAPEQILAKPADLRSDIFSAAVVFFEFLVYAHPFRGEVIPRRIVEGKPDSLLDYNSSIPPPLERILARALKNQIDQRYQTVEQLQTDLQATLDAMLGNSSPTFSGLVLPSDQDLPRSSRSECPARPLDSELLNNPALGEDPYEWRLSEVIRLIPELEQAVKRRDTRDATDALAQLETIEAVDPRFKDAVEICRKSVGVLASVRVAPEPRTEESVERRDANDPPARTRKTLRDDVHRPSGAQSVCFSCGAENRVAATFCIACGIRLSKATGAEPRDEEAGSMASGLLQTAVARELRRISEGSPSPQDGSAVKATRLFTAQHFKDIKRKTATDSTSILEVNRPETSQTALLSKEIARARRNRIITLSVVGILLLLLLVTGVALLRVVAKRASLKLPLASAWVISEQVVPAN